ncbi:MAG: helix-turn-helix domain-containing protein [Sphingobium sp.]
MDVITCSVSDAARALGLGRTRVYELLNSGQIESFTLGRRRLVKVNSIRKLVADNESKEKGGNDHHAFS